MATTIKHRLQDFDFELPAAQIAQHPLSDRTQSRLMVLHRHNPSIAHHVFLDLPACLNPGDLLVFNETKVIPARFFAQKVTGGRVECLMERILDDQAALVHMKSNRPVHIGAELILDHEHSMVVIGRELGLFQVQLSQGRWKTLLDKIGQVPLPPYMTRQASEEDEVRYQTVFARHEGSVAAPTAGLHFDQSLLETLTHRGVTFAFVTLHVGAGTFQPVRMECIEDHVMHQEWMHVDEEVCKNIRATRARGGRVIAVGTTAVRALETAALGRADILSYSGATRLFIYPGYVFRIVDGLITNFHVPKSSLLMLVAAFAGYGVMKRAYQVAIQEQYRFFSYGDSMLILPACSHGFL